MGKGKDSDGRGFESQFKRLLSLVWGQLISQSFGFLPCKTEVTCVVGRCSEKGQAGARRCHVCSWHSVSGKMCDYLYLELQRRLWQAEAVPAPGKSFGAGLEDLCVCL